jgi:hypothetical protein
MDRGTSALSEVLRHQVTGLPWAAAPLTSWFPQLLLSFEAILCNIPLLRLNFYIIDMFDTLESFWFCHAIDTLRRLSFLCAGVLQVYVR